MSCIGYISCEIVQIVSEKMRQGQMFEIGIGKGQHVDMGRGGNIISIMGEVRNKHMTMMTLENNCSFQKPQWIS